MFRRACLQSWCLAGVWELAPDPFPNRFKENHCVDCCKNNVVYGKHPFSFLKLGILDMPGRGYLCNQPNKTLGTESLMGFPRKKYFTYFIVFFIAEKWPCIFCPMIGRREHKETCIWISTDTKCPVSFFHAFHVIYVFFYYHKP